MSSAARDPRPADDLPPLPVATAAVSEAPPDPPPGPERDALADEATAGIERAVAAMEAVLTAYNDRMTGLVAARMRSPKTRRGTRWWTPEPAGGVATKARVELKALDPGYVLPQRVAEDELREALRPVGLRIVTDSAADVARRLGHSPGVGLSAFSWDAVSDTVDDAVGRMLEVNARHARDVRREILHADATAESLDAAIDRVTEATRRGGRWLLLAGRTLATALAGDAALAAARALGVTRTQWLCVTGDTKVWASGALNVARRWSTEGVLRITTSSGASSRRELAVTPDHPILTERGWIAARDINLGDHLISGPLIEGGTRGHPNIQCHPAIISEVFDAAQKSSPTERVMRTPVDFDSDGVGSYVDVVPTHRPLRNRLQPPVIEPRAHEFFALTDLRLSHLLSNSHIGKMLVGQLSSDIKRSEEGITPESSFGRFGCNSGKSRSRLIAPNKIGCLNDFTDLPHIGMKSPTDGTSRFTQSVSCDNPSFIPSVISPPERLSSPSLGERLWPGSETPSHSFGGGQQRLSRAKPSANSLCASVNSDGDLPGGFAGLIATNEVVDIQVDITPRHVYDLQTTTGWFLANGFIIHNSRRDHKVRTTHIDADGQIRPVGAAFNIGGFRLRFPADPSGLPASAPVVYGCRCGLTWVPPSPERSRAVALAGEDAPSSARAILSAAARGSGTARRMTEGSPELGAQASVPEIEVPAEVVAHRVLDAMPPVVAGQRISWPGPLALGLAPAVAAGVALAVMLPVGTAVGIQAGGVVLPAGTALEVLSAEAGRVVARPVSA